MGLPKKTEFIKLTGPKGPADLPKASKPAKAASPRQNIDKTVSEIVATIQPGFDPFHPLPVKTLFGKAKLVATQVPAMEGERAEVFKNVPVKKAPSVQKEKDPRTPENKWWGSTLSCREELFAKNSQRQRLSHLGRLKLALSLRPDGKGVDVGNLCCFAQSPLESQMISLIQREKPDLLAGYTDPVKALAILRIHHFPLLCLRFIQEISKEDGDVSLALGSLAACVHACARTLCEHYWLNGGFPPHGLNSLTKRGDVENWKRQFIMPLLEKSDEELFFWMSRFDEWRHFAEKSWEYYVAEHSSDIRKQTGPLKESGMVAILTLLDGFSSKVFANWTLEEAPGVMEIFMKNARPNRYRAKIPSAELNTWLIEIWPLVWNYAWNSKHLQAVAQEKFKDSTPTPDSTIDLIYEPDELRKHCARLGLRLNARKGRPKPSSDGSRGKVPRMGALALFIDGIHPDLKIWLAGRWSFRTQKNLERLRALAPDSFC